MALNAISSGYLKGLSNGFLDRPSLITKLGVCQTSFSSRASCMKHIELSASWLMAPFKNSQPEYWRPPSQPIIPWWLAGINRLFLRPFNLSRLYLTWRASSWRALKNTKAAARWEGFSSTKEVRPDLSTLKTCWSKVTFQISSNFICSNWIQTFWLHFCTYIPVPR